MSGWMTMEQANTLGAVLGAGFGIIGGGLGGPLMGYMVPRGRAKVLVLTLIVGLLVVGVGLLVTACIAWTMKQPGYVVHPFLLTGGVATIVMGVLLPVIVGGYRAAEQRKLNAEEIRRG